MVDYVNESLFKKDGTDKQFLIEYKDGSIRNKDFNGEDMTLDESLCSGNQLVFGSCESSVLSFQVANVGKSIRGKNLTVGMILNGEETNPFVLGQYKVDTDPLTADKEWRNVTAYDALFDVLNADVAKWYNKILPLPNSTTTMKKFRTSFLNYFDIRQEDVTLPNDDMVITKTLMPMESSESETMETIGEPLSGGTVIFCICELNGCFGHIGRDGKFHYIFLEPNVSGLYPSTKLFPSVELFPRESRSIPVGSDGTYISCEYEEYEASVITGVRIRTEEGSEGVTVGYDDNIYTISGNFLTYGKSADELRAIAENIRKTIAGIGYKPFKLEMAGNPCLEVGDAIRVNTSRDIVESYILKRTLKGIQALSDTLEATGVEKYTEEVNSSRAAIQKIGGKTNILERDLEHTKSVISNLEKSTETRIEQTDEKIRLEAERAYREEQKLSANLNVTAEQISSEVRRAQEAESQILQLADNISLEVKGKVSEGEISSKLSLETGLITLIGKRLIIISDNFKLSENGVYADGTIVAKSGEIGPFIISGNTLTHINGRMRISADSIYVKDLDVETLGISKLLRIEGQSYISGNTYITGDAYLYSVKIARFTMDTTFSGTTQFGGSVSFNSNPQFLSPGSSGSSANVYMGSGGRLNRITSSARKYKNSIRKVTNPELDPHRILEIDVVQFKFNTDYLSNKEDMRYDREVIGLIANDVAEKYPVAADYEDGEVENWNARYLIPPMLALIQEQYKKIEEQGEKIDVLEKRLSSLEDRLAKLEKGGW